MANGFDVPIDHCHSGSAMLREAWIGLAMFIAVVSHGQTPETMPGGKVVSVPALVESKSGQIAYGLSAPDFSVKDDGIEQRVELVDGLSPAPLSLFLLIQTGQTAAAQLAKIAQLDELLDSIVTSPNDEVGIITFDSRPRVVQDLTSDPDKTSSALAGISPGNAGSSIFDALHLAIASLRNAPRQSRRVIILISGEHDRGSYASDSGSLVRAISSVDASIYSLSFSSGKMELLNRLGSINPLAMTASAVHKNAPQALAQLTGGDFYRFDSEKAFEEHVSEIANHIHNRYSLAFHPSDPQPGFHSLQVEVRHAKVNVVSARSGYWLSAASDDGGESQ